MQYWILGGWNEDKTYSLYNGSHCIKVTRDFHNSDILPTERFFIDFFFFFRKMFCQLNNAHVVSQKYNPLNKLYLSKIKHGSILTTVYRCYNWKQNVMICRGMWPWHKNTMFINAVRRLIQQWHSERPACWHLSFSYYNTQPDLRLQCPLEDQERTCSRTTEGCYK